MFITLVHVCVREDSIDAFTQASKLNAEASRLEPGVVRFDVIQQDADRQKFILIEIYRSEEDPGFHKQTAHYLAWRDTVAPMMAEPRQGVRYNIVSPPEDSWG